MSREEEEEEVLKEAKKLSWEDRIFHNNWKVRKDANIDLATLFSTVTNPKDPRIHQFGPFFKKSVADSNAHVQEKALDALVSYLKAADADAGMYAKEVCDAIVTKCLMGRPKTVEKAQMILMLWVELEAVDAFLDAMEKAIKKINAKAVVPAIDVMSQALREFGSNVVPPERVLKMLPELFDRPEGNIRASSKGLTLEICRWIGKQPVKALLFNTMRDTMKKELEAELVSVSVIASPLRNIRSNQETVLEKDAVFGVVGSGPSEDSVGDGYELVDILTPLEKTGFWDGVKAAKWSERKEAVAKLSKLASTKRISPHDFTEICLTLKELITDVNIAVAVEAIQAIENLAKGLGTHFSGNSRLLLPILLEKLKVKKHALSEALSRTLQAMYTSGCLNLADITEDIKSAVKSKAPLVRSSTLNWVTFCIEMSNKSIVTKVHMEYVPICMEGLQSKSAATRHATVKLIGVLYKYVGPDIKRFFKDVKSALRSVLEEEYEKNPFEGASAILKNSAMESGSLPLEDISGKVTPALIKGIESPDWKVCLKSIEAVNKILEEANKPIFLTGTVELLDALRGRLNEHNKNLVIAALSTVGALASAMGPPVQKFSKGILSDILKCLRYHKKHMREITLTTLDLWLASVPFEAMVLDIAAALMDAELGAKGLKDLFDWLSRQLSGLTDFPDAVYLLKATASAMMDSSVDVRRAAEACMAEILRVSGTERLRKYITETIKDTGGSVLAILLDCLKPYRVYQGRHTVVRARRPKLILHAQNDTFQSQLLLNAKDSNKGEREKLVPRWFKFREPRKRELCVLEYDLTRYFRDDLCRSLLSSNFEQLMVGIDMLRKELPSISKEIIEVLDVLLSWFTLRFCELDTCLVQVLDFLRELFDMLSSEGYTMTEAEATIILPTLVEKLGHHGPEVGNKIRELIKNIFPTCSATRTFPYILAGLSSRNIKTRACCSNLALFIVANHGTEIMMQLKVLHGFASSTAKWDAETKEAAAAAFAIGYNVLGDYVYTYVQYVVKARQDFSVDASKALEMDTNKEEKFVESMALLRLSAKEDGTPTGVETPDVTDISEQQKIAIEKVLYELLANDITDESFPLAQNTSVRPKKYGKYKEKKQRKRGLEKSSDFSAQP